MCSSDLSLPVELEEAAIVDGAGLWVIISRIFAPIMGPSLVTTGLLAFIGAWNEFMFTLTFIISNEQRTVPVAIGMLQGASQFELPWGNIMAEGRVQFTQYPGNVLFPALFLVPTVLAINLLGDGLRDALDPRQR